MNQSGTNIFEEYKIKPLIPIQGANKAGIMPDGSLAGTRPEHEAKLTLFERLFGRSASPTDQVSAENITVSQTPRVGGIFPDMAAGYNENRNTPISVNNFGQNKLDDGRNKGFAYKLGEGLGSLARFAESPAGRGLLVAGLVGATGGGALPALAFGGSTSLMNQQNRAKDQLYRNALKQQGVDTSNIRGFVGDDTFKYLLEDQQLRDNAEYRKLYYDMQQQNQKDLMEFRKWQAEKEAEQNKIDNYYKGQQIAQGWKKLEQDAMGNVDTEAIKEIESAEAIISQLEEAHKKLPQYSYPKGTQKVGAILTGASSQLGLDTNAMSAYKAISKGTVSPLLRKLGEKGALSDGDVRRGEQLQPSPYDTPEQAAAKIAELRALFEKARVALMGRVQTTKQTQATTNEGWAF
jgi:hypothetical protein